MRAVSMNAPAATFEVQEILHLAGKSDTYLVGKIRTGLVRAGMHAKISRTDEPLMSARINGIELVRDLSQKSDCALALDTPEAEARAAWKRICRKGAVIPIETDAS